MRDIRRATIIAGLALLALPAGTAGKVYVAPNSPAGFQYGAPLESARREGSGGGGTAGAPGSAERAPVFGAGIGRYPGGSPGGANDSGESVASAVTKTPGAQSAADLRVAGLSLGVLAVGLLIGLGLRRRSEPTPG